jgi:hypothetical protein
MQDHHVPYATGEQMGSKKTPKTKEPAPSAQVSARLSTAIQEPFNAALEGHNMDRTKVINALIKLGLDAMGGDVDQLIAAYLQIQEEEARAPKKK